MAFSSYYTETAMLHFGGCLCLLMYGVYININKWVFSNSYLLHWSFNNYIVHIIFSMEHKMCYLTEWPGCSFLYNKSEFWLKFWPKKKRIDIINSLKHSFSWLIKQWRTVNKDDLLNQILKCCVHMTKTV